MTPSKKTNEDLTSLLRARHTLIWMTTREEVRVERAIIEAAAKADFNTKFWDCATGLSTSDGKPEVASLQDPQSMLNRIRDEKKRGVYVLRDLHKWFDPMILRGLRSLARNLQGATRNEARCMIIITPSSEVPPELAGHATVIDYPLPAREEIGEILKSVIEALPPEIAEKAAPNGTFDAAVDAAVGLTAEEAANCYAQSIVTTKKIEPARIASEKRRIIAREKVLT